MVFVSREPIIPNIWWNVTFDVFEMMLWFWIQVNNFEKVSFIYILPKNLNKKNVKMFNRKLKKGTISKLLTCTGVNVEKTSAKLQEAIDSLNNTG